MTLRYLVDTNTLSELARSRPDAQVLTRLRSSPSALATSTLCWHELRFGVARLGPSRNRDRLAAIVREIGASLSILPFDQSAAEWLAEERGRLERAGRPVSIVDAMIAAVAATRGLTLVTRNVRDFDALRGVDVVSWHAS